jgi:hypothetical protein
MKAFRNGATYVATSPGCMASRIVSSSFRFSSAAMWRMAMLSADLEAAYAANPSSRSRKLAGMGQ